MQPDTTLQEEFQRARMNAVALSDEYFARPADDPRRAALWHDVATETERARSLLERWLDQPEATEASSSADAHELILA